MLLLGTILAPFIAALAALAWPSGKSFSSRSVLGDSLSRGPSGERRLWLLPLAAAGHSMIVLRLMLWSTPASPGAWLSLDPLGILLMGLTSVIFLGCSIYGVGYLRQRPERDNRLFVACFLFMLSSASLVAASRHLGLLWVGMEATTLSAAPLIHFKRSDRSLEATWKYLIMGSIGIGLALLGTFFLALASTGLAHGALALHLDVLLAHGPTLSVVWLKGAFIFILVGYGTKMGLAPLHSWKPDAYGEAPGMAGAVLAGVLTSCSFVGILRVYQVCAAAGQAAFADSLLVLMGVLSLGVAAVFMVSQRDFKRLLAYSSVEHMGVLALGVGVGGAGAFAALLHLVNNALAKGLLFLTAGNIHRAYGDKTLDRVHGALRRLPVSAGLFLAGFLAITGSPPFGPFISELTLLRAAASAGRWGIVMAFIGLMAIIFIGMAGTALSAVQGEPPVEMKNSHEKESLWLIATPGAFALALLVLGLYLPPWLTDGISRAAALLSEGTP